MGIIGKIIKSFIQKTPGLTAESQFSTVELEQGNNQDLQVWGPSNEDFSPPSGIYALQKNVGRGNGFIITYAYHNSEIQPVALPGERRIYATTPTGETVKSETFLRNDGTIIIKNDNASITVTPTGEVEIVSAGNTEITSTKTIINNDVEIYGKLDVTGTITAPEINGNGIAYTTHVHEQGADSDGDSEQDTDSPKDGS